MCLKIDLSIYLYTKYYICVFGCTLKVSVFFCTKICHHFKCVWFFSPSNMHMKNIATQKLSQRNPLESVDTGIVKVLGNFQYWTEK